MSSTTTPEPEIYDVIIVGAGNAGFSAATTAIQTLRSLSPSHPRVLILEKAPHASSGGNTFYTAGAYRFTFSSLSSLIPLISYNDVRGGLPDTLASKIEMQPYTERDFLEDLNRVTAGRADAELAKVLVARSREAVEWIADLGGMWELSFHRQAYEVDGVWRFWGGLVVCFKEGGKGLVRWHQEVARREGVEVRYGCEVVGLVEVDGGNGVCGVDVVEADGEGGKGQKRRIMSRGGVVLASGGFQASAKLRARYLGSEWEKSHVRGSPTNTGDMHELMLLSTEKKLRARSAGHFEGCHSVCWDASSPSQGGNRVLTNQYTKSGYPLGIMVNARGERFVDEGADLRNYTYAVFGREVLKQPGGVAWQIWDCEGRSLLRKEEYDRDVTELIEAETLEELVEKLGECGMEGTQNLLQTVREYNLACDKFQEENPDVGFDPAKKDGLSTQSNSHQLALPKSNWARKINKGPFTAVKVTCGITFTFGGLMVMPETAEVVADDGDESEKKPIQGLYCCGELMGGLFWDNYPGGSGLTAGIVFGRIAGKHAAERAARDNRVDVE